MILFEEFAAFLHVSQKLRMRAYNKNTKSAPNIFQKFGQKFFEKLEASCRIYRAQSIPFKIVLKRKKNVIQSIGGTMAL